MNDPVVIVGAGFSGLTAAKTLHEQGVPFVLLEASDAVGGRARTDLVDGFLLDRGFQVFLTAYPEAQRHLRFSDLDLQCFEPGSLIRYGNQFHTLVDPWRRPTKILSTAFSGVGSLSDKWRIALLRNHVNRGSLSSLFERRDETSYQMLTDFGFSPRMIESFLRPFFGGVFLDHELETSCRMLYFVFRMFGLGDAALPTNGMGAISQQLADCLPEESLRLNTPVVELSSNEVMLRGGDRVPFNKVLFAVDEYHAAQFFPELSTNRPQRKVTTIYFAASRSPSSEKMLVLNGSGQGIINHICIPSDVASNYSPQGETLVSITVLKQEVNADALIKEVLAESKSWFGGQVDQWHHLRTDQIERALPNQSPPAFDPPFHPSHLRDSFYVCGDYRANGSINGAMQSGRLAAEEIVRRS